MRRIAILSLLIIGALRASAGSIVTTKATAVSAPTAAEQLARASRIIEEISHTPPPRKLELFGEACANLIVTRRRWPDDRRAFVRSGVMQADLAAEFGAWAQAVDPLLEARRPI